jgi:hypothetical protein
MSVIAIRWAYSREIKNPVAKNVLVFLSTHDFPGNTSVFKINTICRATSYSEKPVRNALKELHRDGYISKQERFGDDGGKLSNSYTLLIPPEYVQEFCTAYDLSTPLRSERPEGQVAATAPLRSERPDNKNNAFKLNVKKSSCASPDQKANSTVEKATSGMKTTPVDRKAENERKHPWADKPKPVSPMADVSKQSTSFNPESVNVTKANPETVRQAMMKLPRCMRPKSMRELLNTTEGVSNCVSV